MVALMKQLKPDEPLDAVRGVCPIVSTDSHRAVLSLALLAVKQIKLTKYFTAHHPRVIQFACCVSAGSSKMYHLVSLFLGKPCDLQTEQGQCQHDLKAKGIVTCDVSNAYNSLTRVSMMEMVTGVTMGSL